MRTVTVTCAGPHLEPVALYEVSYDESTPTRPHRALCGDCGAVYVAGVTAAGDDPDRLAPGQLPDEARVQRHNQRRDPAWTPPPHNYRSPKSV